MITASLSDAALLIPSAAVPPAATSFSIATALTSKPATECPPLARLIDIGNPMLPRPMKPMRAMCFLPIAGVHPGRSLAAITERATYPKIAANSAATTRKCPP